MSLVQVRIPQIGEGLREARLVAVLKQPGDKVRRDEPIYQMETDKAVMDVESPYDGTLVEWLANADDVLLIGADVATMEVQTEVAESVDIAPPSLPAEQPKATIMIPPRTRAYAKEKGVSDADLANIEGNGKLMPSDIDVYLASKAKKGYSEAPLTSAHRLLASRLTRGTGSVVAGTMTMVADWQSIEQAKQKQISLGGDFQPSTFTMFAFAVAKALGNHPAFRSALIGDDTLRTYESVSLGIAVGLPGDELVLAVVDRADSLAWLDFAAECRDKIRLAREGKDQANESVTLSLTNMQAFGLRDAVPVVVAPSVATLFLGEVYKGIAKDGTVRNVANLALSFDHRVVNGVGAAKFLNEVRERVESINDLIF